MKVSETQNQDEGAEHTTRCLTCRNETPHHVIYSFRRLFDDNEWNWCEDYQVISCRICGAPSFRSERSDQDSVQTVPETGEDYLASEVVYYPSRQTRAEMRDTQFLPLGLQAIYREVLGAFASGNPMLTAIGLRAAIETVCRERGKTGDLKTMIDQLFSEGVLRSEEAHIFHQLRNAGNISAHECHAFTGSELLHAIETVEHILTTIYLLRHQATKLPATKQRGKN